MTKSDLEGRPVYVWTDEHIQGHFLTCYLALVLYRLLQRKLENKYPIHQIKEALNNAIAIRIATGAYLMHDTDMVFKAILDVFGGKLDYEVMKEEKFARELKRIKEMYSQ